MIQKTIRDTKFFQMLGLQEKTNPTAFVYKGELLNAEQTVAPILEYIKNQFPNFTEHGISHSIGIIEAVYNILSRDLMESLSSAEIYCFMMSALFHDMGMTTDEEPDIDKRRMDHHLYAKRPIIDYMYTRALGMREAKRLADCIMYAAESHGKEIRSLYEEKSFTDKDDVDGECIRYGLIAILLRIGDLLDLEEGRTNEFNLELNPQYYGDSISQEHHQRHLEVKRFHKNDNAIEICIETKNRQRYKIWRGWLDYLDQEIMYANTHYLPKLDQEIDGKVIRYRLPEVKDDLKAAAGSDFRVEEVKFQLDEKGTLLDIITRSIYTNEFDYIRELIQNGIDAVLLKEYQNLVRKIDAVSPRCWNVKTLVAVAYSAKDNMLIVADDGIGMDEAEIRNYLFRAADSGYRYKKVTRNFKFPSIAKFGIGFVACLTKMEQMEVTTQAKGKEKIQIALESSSMTAFIEQVQGSAETGTIITLTPKHSFQFRELWEYLKKMFCCPSVDIIVIDLDQLKELENKLGVTKEEVEKTKWSANWLTRRIDGMESERNRMLNPYLKEQKHINSIFNYVQELNFGEKEKNAVEVCRVKMEALYELMDGSEAMDYIENQRRIFENLQMALKKKEIHQARLLSVKLRDQCAERMKVYSGPWNRIQNKQMKNIASFKTAYLNLSSNFNVIKVQTDEDHFDLGRQGIVFVSCEIEDYDMGIEWQSVHGFLCYEGEIVKYLSVLCLKNDEESPEEWVIGLDDPEEVMTEYNYMEINIENDLSYIDEQKEWNDYLFDVIGFFDNEFKKYSMIPEHALGGMTEYEGINLIDSENWVYCPDQVGLIDFGNSLACQDGIRVDVRPEAIVPFGCCKANVNLTACARLELNVSRHEISQNIDQVEDWMNKCGYLIQEKVLDQLTGQLKKMDIKFDEKILNDDRSAESVFEKICMESAFSLLKKK